AGGGGGGGGGGAGAGEGGGRGGGERDGGGGGVGGRGGGGGGRAAVLPRLLRHRQTQCGRRRPGGHRYRCRLRAGRLCAGRWRDRRDARHARRGCRRHVRFLRLVAGQVIHDRRQQRAGLCRDARPNLHRPPP